MLTHGARAILRAAFLARQAQRMLDPLRQWAFRSKPEPITTRSPARWPTTPMPTSWVRLAACSLSSAVYSCVGIFFTSLPSCLDANHRPLKDEKRWANLVATSPSGGPYTTDAGVGIHAIVLMLTPITHAISFQGNFNSARIRIVCRRISSWVSRGNLRVSVFYVHLPH